MTETQNPSPRDAPEHGGQLTALAARFSLDPATLLDFSANINPEGPPPAVFETLQTALKDPQTLSQYPDLKATALKQALSRHTGLPAENLVVANGFVPLLEAALRTLQPATCVLPVPCFGDYRRTLERCNVGVSPVALAEQNDFTYPLASLLTGSPPAVLLANPQNPSGTLTHELGPFLQAAERTGTIVLLDEAFIDYTPEASLLPHLFGHPNLLLFRSLTKFFAIPGLRVAYAAAAPALVRSITANLPPWPISTLASVGAIAALTPSVYAAETITLNRRRREQLTAALRQLGLHVYPASANFLLLRLPVDATATWERLLREHGIVTRLCTNFEALPPRHLRIAVRDESANERLLLAFRTLFAP